MELLSSLQETTNLSSLRIRRLVFFNCSANNDPAFGFVLPLVNHLELDISFGGDVCFLSNVRDNEMELELGLTYHCAG